MPIFKNNLITTSFDLILNENNNDSLTILAPMQDLTRESGSISLDSTDSFCVERLVQNKLPKTVWKYASTMEFLPK